MKRLYAILAAAAIICAAHLAPAQQYSTFYVSSNGVATMTLDGGTNTVTALKTNSFYIVPLTKYGDVGLEFQFTHHTAGATSNLLFNIWESLDGTSKPTLAPRYVIALTATGTTAVRAVTNFTVGPVGYLLLEPANTNAALVFTNVQVRYVPKPKRFGN
jgi:hypothetical protein